MRALETVWASWAVGRLTLPSALAGAPGALGEGSEHTEQRKLLLLQLPLTLLPRAAKLLQQGLYQMVLMPCLLAVLAGRIPG